MELGNLKKKKKIISVPAKENDYETHFALVPPKSYIPGNSVYKSGLAITRTGRTTSNHLNL